MTEHRITENVTTDQKHVSCDGGTMEHPKVYLHIDQKGYVVCPYCSRRYILEENNSRSAS